MSAASHAPVSLTRRALPYAALLFLLVGAHGLLETARDGLFLVEQPITRLPWLYLAVTAGVLVLTPVQRRLWSGRLHVALPLTLAAAAAVTLGFWAFAAARSTVLGFYVWTALFSSLVFVQFWLTADEAFRVDEAKRAFGFIAAGGLLGAVSGTGVARIALDYTDPRTLLLISAGATQPRRRSGPGGDQGQLPGPGRSGAEMTAARAIPGTRSATRTCVSSRCWRSSPLRAPRSSTTSSRPRSLEASRRSGFPGWWPTSTWDRAPSPSWWKWSWWASCSAAAASPGASPCFCGRARRNHRVRRGRRARGDADSEDTRRRAPPLALPGGNRAALPPHRPGRATR